MKRLILLLVFVLMARKAPQSVLPVFRSGMTKATGFVAAVRSEMARMRRRTSVLTDARLFLGLPPSPGPDEIKLAYKKMAWSCHPDLNPADPDALRRFVTATAAYEILLDPPPLLGEHAKRRNS